MHGTSFDDAPVTSKQRNGDGQLEKHVHAELRRFLYDRHLPVAIRLHFGGIQ